METKYGIQVKNMIIYILVLFIVCIILAFIVSYFMNIIKSYDDKLSSSNDYTMLNLYFLKIVNEKNVLIRDYGLVNSNDNTSYYISFLGNDGKENLFIKIDGNIYFNNIKICENVDEFKVIVDKSYKQVINVETKINETVYNMQYSLSN